MSLRTTALAVLALGLAVSGCGDLPTPDKGKDPLRPYRIAVHPRTVTPSEIAGQPAGSPQRALLEWFGAIQQGRARQAADLYDPALGIRAPAIRRQRRLARNFFRYVGIDRLLDTRREGDRATVFAFLSRAWRAPNRRVNQYDQAQAFDLIRVGGRWLLADDYFLQLTAVPRPFAGS